MFLRQKLFGKPIQQAAKTSAKSISESSSRTSKAVMQAPAFRSASSSHLKAFATIDPNNLSQSDKGFNLVGGQWTSTKQYMDLIDPLKGGTMIRIPDTQTDEIDPFVASLQECPKTGLHNPFKNKERYLMLSEVNRKVVECMHDPEVFDFFVRCIQRTAPKSKA